VFELKSTTKKHLCDRKSGLFSQIRLTLQSCLLNQTSIPIAASPFFPKHESYGQYGPGLDGFSSTNLSKKETLWTCLVKDSTANVVLSWAVKDSASAIGCAAKDPISAIVHAGWSGKSSISSIVQTSGSE